MRPSGGRLKDRCHPRRSTPRGIAVLVSSTVRDLVAGSGIRFCDAGVHELKGVPDAWHLYRVASAI